MKKNKKIPMILVIMCVILSGCTSYTDDDIERIREEAYKEGYEDAEAYFEQEPSYEDGREDGRAEIINEIEYYYGEYGHSVTLASILENSCLEDEEYETLKTIIYETWIEEYADKVWNWSTTN